MPENIPRPPRKVAQNSMKFEPKEDVNKRDKNGADILPPQKVAQNLLSRCDEFLLPLKRQRTKKKKISKHEELQLTEDIVKKHKAIHRARFNHMIGSGKNR